MGSVVVGSTAGEPEGRWEETAAPYYGGRAEFPGFLALPCEYPAHDGIGAVSSGQWLLDTEMVPCDATCSPRPR